MLEGVAKAASWLREFPFLALCCACGIRAREFPSAPGRTAWQRWISERRSRRRSQRELIVTLHGGARDGLCGQRRGYMPEVRNLKS